MGKSATNVVPHVYAVLSADVDTLGGDDVDEVAPIAFHRRHVVWNAADVANDARCPRCGAGVDGRSVCAACDFIVDTTDLGDDILDDLAHLRLRAHAAGERTRWDGGTNIVTRRFRALRTRGL